MLIRWNFKESAYLLVFFVCPFVVHLGQFLSFIFVPFFFNCCRHILFTDGLTLCES